MDNEDTGEADNPFNQAQFEQAIQPTQAIPDDSETMADSIIDDIYETPIAQNKRRNSDAYESEFWKNTNTGINNNQQPYTHNSNGQAYENNSQFMSVPETAYIAHEQISSNTSSTTNNNNNNQSLNQTFTSVKKTISNLFKNEETKQSHPSSNATYNSMNPQTVVKCKDITFIFISYNITDT